MGFPPICKLTNHKLTNHKLTKNKLTNHAAVASSILSVPGSVISSVLLSSGPSRPVIPCVPGFLFRGSVFTFGDSGFGFRDSGFGLRVSGFGFRDSGFGFRVSGFGI
jgi:hypothetical protein